MNKIATLEFLDQSLFGILPRLHLSKHILTHPLSIIQKRISKCRDTGGVYGVSRHYEISNWSQLVINQSILVPVKSEMSDS